MYVNDNKQNVCAVNWGGGRTVNGNVLAGWLYQCSLYPTPMTPTDMEAGVLYQYIRTKEIYRCPGAPQDTKIGMTGAVTSYLMNGAMNAYGTQKIYKITRFKSDDAVIWEADERAYNGVPPFNDGSSFPNESFDSNTPEASGLAVRHGKYATIGFVGGHAELVQHVEIYARARDPGRNWLWCSPETANGH